MNIVLINHYAGSPYLGMEYRPFYMAKEWIKLGHKVIVVAGAFSHLRSKNSTFSSSLHRETIDGVEYIWLKTNHYHGNGIGRVISMFVFCWRLYSNLGKILKSFNPDVVIASSTYPLDNFPARHFASRYGAKHCYEVHDLWPLSVVELGGYSKKHPFIKLLQYAEDYSYRNADFIVSMLPNAREHMIAHSMKQEKYCHIPNGISKEEWTDLVPNSQTARRIKDLSSEKKFSIGYVGGFAVANALENLIDAAVIAHKELPEAIFILIGTGTEKRDLMEKVRQLRLDNVYFLDPIPKLEVPAVLSVFDALYLGSLRNPLYRFGISPNKLFDYMMAGKPIIHAVEAGNDIVSAASCGIRITPDQPSLVVKAITDLIEIGRDQRVEMGLRGKAYVTEHHTYEVLAKRFVDFLQQKNT